MDKSKKEPYQIQKIDSCNCGHEHHQEHPTEEHSHSKNSCNSNGVKFTCLIEHLGCANCAAKMERRINDLPEVNAATLTFATKQLRVIITPEAARNETALIEKFQDICSSIESEVIVSKQQTSQKGKKILQINKEHSLEKNRFSEQQLDLISIII